MIPITKDGLSATSPSASKEASDPIDNTKERMSDFIEKHSIALANGDEWCETTPEIIKLLQPRGMGGAKYFCYKGVKVCEYGKIDEIEAQESKTVHDRMHPDSKTVVISGAV